MTFMVKIYKELRCVSTDISDWAKKQAFIGCPIDENIAFAIQSL